LRPNAEGQEKKQAEYQKRSVFVCHTRVFIAEE
jgi:hypothetical protein